MCDSKPGWMGINPARLCVLFWNEMKRITKLLQQRSKVLYRRRLQLYFTGIFVPFCWIMHVWILEIFVTRKQVWVMYWNASVMLMNSVQNHFSAKNEVWSLSWPWSGSGPARHSLWCDWKVKLCTPYMLIFSSSDHIANMALVVALNQLNKYSHDLLLYMLPFKHFIAVPISTVSRQLLVVHAYLLIWVWDIFVRNEALLNRCCCIPGALGLPRLHILRSTNTNTQQSCNSLLLCGVESSPVYLVSFVSVSKKIWWIDELKLWNYSASHGKFDFIPLYSHTFSNRVWSHSLPKNSIFCVFPDIFSKVLLFSSSLPLFSVTISQNPLPPLSCVTFITAVVLYYAFSPGCFYNSFAVFVAGHVAVMVAIAAFSFSMFLWEPFLEFLFMFLYPLYYCSFVSVQVV